MRDVSITQALHEGGIGPIPIGVIGSPETSHADHGFMTDCNVEELDAEMIDTTVVELSRNDR